MRAIFKKVMPIIIVFIVGFALFNLFDNTRSIDGTLMSSFTNNGVKYAYFATSDGNGWVADWSDDYQFSKTYKITFDCMGTNDIHDDEIIKIDL